jgi:uncharacterized SAM-binding protein YcdF (DUF218 family)
MTRRRKIVLALFAIALIPVVVLGVTGVAVWRAAHTDDASRIDSTDAIVVLGAAQYNGTPSPVLAGRLDQALILYHEGRAPTVIVVGGNQPGDKTTEAQSGADYLVAHGIPSTSVVPIPVGNSTFESLQAAADYMHKNGMNSAFLVSDPWHNLRIKKMASDLGIQGYASATWHSAAVSEQTRIPGYVRETLAYIYYRIFGR